MSGMGLIRQKLKVDWEQMHIESWRSVFSTVVTTKLLNFTSNIYLYVSYCRQIWQGRTRNK